MVVDMDILSIIERFGVAVALVIIFTMIAARFLNYLDNRADADEARQKSWDEIRKQDNQQWVALLGGQKVALDSAVMSISELHKSITEDRTRNMAYQNTSTTALAELLTILKEWRGVPADMKKANETLGIIQKGQVGLTESEARRELETKAELARMNNVMLGIQTAIAKLETAVGQLPMAVQKVVAPTFAPILTAIDELLVVAKDTQNKLVEKNLGEAIPTPNPSPLNGGGGLVTPMVDGGADGMNVVPTNTGEDGKNG